ncbi:T9SS C-terminal target domain-containing protein [Flavobacterium sp. Sd200]|uniref:GEVED domain-containing protein n=1 Tax=Flavobacterium sp. Sd200 TaxID=2692211 RepID=UPI00136A1EC2|nr:fibronectin type III domain-containing protein [Flavobacterium sp. Sd200]MXN92434.1 T9SS C-terminal target domain-containing protein [Flavobacterium sp. Sd200]
MKKNYNFLSRGHHDQQWPPGHDRFPNVKKTVMLLGALLLMLNWAPAFAQVPGDTCATAIDLATLTSPFSGTTVGATNDFLPTCNGTNTAPDLFYSIVVPNGYRLNIGQTVNNYDSVHSVFYGSCGTQTQIRCTDDPDTPTDGTTSQVEWTNTTGTTQTVYWVQDGYNTSNGTFTLQWTLTAPPACVVPNTLSVVLNTDGTANFSWVAPNAGGTPTGYEYAVTSSATPPASGTGVTATSVTGYTDIQPSTLYYLHVRTACGTDGFSEWVTSTPFQNLPGDSCINAIDLATLTSPYSGTTVGALNDSNYTCAGGNTSPDLFFYIEVPNGYTLVIGQTENGYDSENYVAYGTTCPGTTQIACFDDPDVQNITWVNTTGTTQNVYWIQDGYNNNVQVGTFTLAWTLTAPPTCVVPMNVTVVPDVDNTANLSWVAPTAGGTPVGYEYAVTTSATPPASGTATTATSITDYTGIAPTTIYYLHVRTNCGATDGYSEWVTSAPFQSLVGDNCQSAINLGTLTSPITASTVGFNNDSTYTCAGGNTSPDIFYYIEVPNGYTLVIGQTENGYDSENYVAYGTTCPGTTQIACFDDPDTTTVTWVNTTGETQNVYWIQDGYNNNAQVGTFTLAWTLTPPPTCVVPTQVTAVADLNGTADLSWVAPTAGGTPTGYEYAVTTSATPPATGTAITETSVTDYPGIAASTTYYLHVRTNCGNDGYSEWVTSTAFQSLVGDTCESAINLATLTSPITASTVGFNNDSTYTCAGGNTSPDIFYYIEVPVGYTLVIGQTSNNYDSENYVAYGTTCPGTTQIACFDDPDVQNITWENTTGSTQNVYWIQDGYNVITQAGTFTLAWTLTAPPACNIPTVLTANLTSTTTVNLAWGAPVTGTPTGYEYAVTTSNTPPASGTATTELSVTGATATAFATNYVYVRTNCGNDGYSEWVRTSFYAGHCVPAPTSVDGTGITNFSLGTINNTTGTETNNYGDYTAQVANAGQGTIQTFSVTFTTGAATYDSKVWVDWNNDLDFTDEGEEVFVGTTGGATNNTLTGTFTVPLTAALGPHRLRVGGVDFGPATPCWTATWGSFEDYTLNVTDPPSCFTPQTPRGEGVASNTANLSWSAPLSGTPEGYEYYVSTSSGTPPASGTPTTGTSVTGYTGIIDNTLYYLYVRTNCGNGDYSEWIVSPGFRFLMGDICASAINLGAQSNPYSYTTVGANHDSTYTCANGNTAPDLYYYIEVPNGYTLTIGQTENGYDSENYVSYGTSCASTTQIACFDDPDIQNITWENLTGSTQNVYWIQDGYLNNTNAGTFTLAWELVGPVTCDVPREPVVSLTSPSTANISWTAPNTGSPAGYEYAVTTSQAPPASGYTFTADLAVTGVAVTPNATNYLHVRSNCGDVDGNSLWVSTSFFGGYCIPTNNGSTANYISGVSTTTALVDFSNTGTGFSGYTDYSAQYSVTTYAAGSFGIVATHPTGTATYSVWVDWNNDFDFDDPGETEIVSNFLVSPAAIGNVTVPANAAQGSYRMRIRNANLGTPTPVCGNFTFGEAEDYTLIVGPTPTCFEPYGLEITTIDATTVDLSWGVPVLGNPPAGYQYVFGPSATPPAEGSNYDYSTISYVGGVTYNPAVSNYLYVRSVCGEGDYSQWVNTAILDIDAPETIANSIIVYKEGNNINITSANNTLITGVTLFDTRGRKLHTENGINSIQAVINGMQIQQQVIIVQINTEKGKVSKRIVF